MKPLLFNDAQGLKSVPELESEERESASINPSDSPSFIANKCVAFVGKLGGLSRRDAMRLAREEGAFTTERPSDQIDLIVIGADESPLADEHLLTPEVQRAARLGNLEVIHETEFWTRLGFVDGQNAVKKLYTPAMLAELLGVSVQVVRRWHRSGLIQPARTVHKLPYFDFQEIATARHLAELVSAGASFAAIKQKIESIALLLPDAERPLAQLSVIVEGRDILLRQGEGLVEPSGQLRIDFEALQEKSLAETDDDAPAVLSYVNCLGPAQSMQDEAAETTNTGQPQDPLLKQAFECEDAGYFEAAVDCYHTILARDGARPDIAFLLGDLLYRMGETWAARERYLTAIELDPDFVEARASLGGLLVELGRKHLAIAAFRGALAVHDEYPDVHYSLARTLDETGERSDADHHWQRFLQLAPESPWADEARLRLESSPS